jgi:hypothetical protein
VALAEAEAVEHARGHGGQGLEGLGGRAQEHRAGVAAAADGAVGRGEPPREAVHALDVAATANGDGAGGGHPTTVSAPGSTS